MILRFYVEVSVPEDDPPEWMNVHRSKAVEQMVFEQAIAREIDWHLEHDRGLPDVRVRALTREP